jgi:hypothetical protein
MRMRHGVKKKIRELTAGARLACFPTALCGILRDERSKLYEPGFESLKARHADSKADTLSRTIDPRGFYLDAGTARYLVSGGETTVMP